jgi:NAD(P)-dependent dehydrogenase (short-subunit alcohol dehydrogenase family)
MTQRRLSAGSNRLGAALCCCPVTLRMKPTASHWWIARSRNSASSTFWSTTPQCSALTKASMRSAQRNGIVTFRTNIYSMFYLSKAALRHMGPGAASVNTTSINAKNPSPSLLANATTKGAIANFTAGLAQLVAEKGVRVNCVAPGPIWTPLIPSTMPAEEIESFGKNTPMGRAGQPAELAPAYVLLASDEASYMTGALLPVTGGRPML